jgi:hypothetical protein
LVYPIEPESDEGYCHIDDNKFTRELDESSIFWRYESTRPLQEREIECEELIDDIHSERIVYEAR